MKNSDKIEIKSKNNFLKLNDSDLLNGNCLNLLLNYSIKRNPELEKLNETRTHLNKKDKIETKITDKNSKDFFKKKKEYNQLIDVFAELNISYEIIDLNTEIFDTIVKIDNEIIGIEITQLITKPYLKEFYESTRKILNRIEKTAHLKNSFISITLNEHLFFEDKKKFAKIFEFEIDKLINLNYKENFDTILKYDVQKIEDERLYIYIDNYPSVNNSIDNGIVSKILNKKDDKLSKKIGNNPEFLKYNKWLLIYSEGHFYDDYIKIEKHTFQNLSCNNFDKMLFFNRKKTDIIIIEFR